MSSGADVVHRGAAFFDLDRTVIGGSSLYVAGLVAWRNGKLPTRELVRDLLSAVVFRLSGASDDKTEQVRDATLSRIVGHRRSDLDALAEQVVPRLLDDVRREAQRLIDLHHESGRDTYIISASPVEILDPLAAALGMTGAVGTVAEIIDGVYTGRLAAPFCYGPGKAQAVAELCAERGYDLHLCYAYSDSAGDLPMLELVGHPVAVNPDAILARVAASRGWPVVEFSQTRKKLIRLTTASTGAAGLTLAAYLLGRRHGRIRATS